MPTWWPAAAWSSRGWSVLRAPGGWGCGRVTGGMSARPGGGGRGAGAGGGGGWGGGGGGGGGRLGAGGGGGGLSGANATSPFLIGGGGLFVPPVPPLPA